MVQQQAFAPGTYPQADTSLPLAQVPSPNDEHAACTPTANCWDETKRKSAISGSRELFPSRASMETRSPGVHVAQERQVDAIKEAKPRTPNKNGLG